MAFGLDFAWGRPGVSAIKSSGAQFVCRYLSHDTTGKNLDSTEVKAYSDNGINIVCVWETTANRTLDGFSAGAQDARDAASQAHSLGMPGDRPIYFANDFDAEGADLARVLSYLQGAASVIGDGRTGLYGGYSVMNYAMNHGVRWGWQTYGWSGNAWEQRAQIQQYSNSHPVNGVDCDYNRTTTSDYGQWRLGWTPVQRTDEMQYGELKTGVNSVDCFPVMAGSHSITFAVDNGLQGLPTAPLRLAVRDKNGWHVNDAVEVDSTRGNTVINFADPSTVNAVSIRRKDDGKGALSNVGWLIS